MSDRPDRNAAWGPLAPHASEANIKLWQSWPAGKFAEFKKTMLKKSPKGKELASFTIQCSKVHVTKHRTQGEIEVQATDSTKALEIAMEAMKSGSDLIKWNPEPIIETSKVPNYETKRIYK